MVWSITKEMPRFSVASSYGRGSGPSTNGSSDMSLSNPERLSYNGPCFGVAYSAFRFGKTDNSRFVGNLSLIGKVRFARDPGIIQKRRCKRPRTCSGLLVLVRWQPHPTQQVSVAGVGADVPETRV